MPAVLMMKPLTREDGHHNGRPKSCTCANLRSPSLHGGIQERGICSSADAGRTTERSEHTQRTEELKWLLLLVAVILPQRFPQSHTGSQVVVTMILLFCSRRRCSRFIFRGFPKGTGNEAGRGGRSYKNCSYAARHHQADYLLRSSLTLGH